MLSLDLIQLGFPAHLRDLKRQMLREYLQCKILDIIFKSIFANKLSFLGGTALRIVRGNQRFSEDLDFDNFNLTNSEFVKISEIVKKGLEFEGCTVEIRNVFKGAFRCYLKLPEILYANELTSNVNEKLLIQLDTFGHGFEYESDVFELKRFDIQSNIKVTPNDILLSQKFFAAFDRKRLKGRDFYDIIFLLSIGTKPNYDYLKKKLQIQNEKELRTFIANKSQGLDFVALANDVRPFLFNPTDKRVESFVKYVESSKLS